MTKEILHVTKVFVQNSEDTFKMGNVCFVVNLTDYGTCIAISYRRIETRLILRFFKDQMKNLQSARIVGRSIRKFFKKSTTKLFVIVNKASGK